MIKYLFIIYCITFSFSTLAQQPWEYYKNIIDKSSVKELPITCHDWKTIGKDGVVSVTNEIGPWGGEYFTFEVINDRFRKGVADAWPACEISFTSPLDFRGYNALTYWIYMDWDDKTNIPLTPLRFIMQRNGLNTYNRVPHELYGNSKSKVKKWIQVIEHFSPALPELGKINKLHFYLCGNEYPVNSRITFKIGGFNVCKTEKALVKLLPEQAAVAVWTGKDKRSEKINFYEENAEIPVNLSIGTGQGVKIFADDILSLRFHELFSGETTDLKMKLGRNIDPGSVVEFGKNIHIEKLIPGYYLIIADICRGDRSLLGGRVGADDLYIRGANESMIFSILSTRTGMLIWLRDLIHGGIMGFGKPGTSHTYSPLNNATYPDYLRLFSFTTAKGSEWNEAGCTGIVLAAEAFRKCGDMKRCRFAENMLDSSINHMLSKMQMLSGGFVSYMNELKDNGMAVPLDNYDSRSPDSYDSNQIGECMKAVSYAIIYYSKVPEKKEYARQLASKLRKSADFIVKNAVGESDGINNMLLEGILTRKNDGSFENHDYHQAGKRCYVYAPRLLSGFSYYIYAMQLLGEKVPDKWWEILDNTIKWSIWKMRYNGWFDWACGDFEENGCHTYLGNLYLGEACFGVYSAETCAGLKINASLAAAAAARAYSYVTDHCTSKGKRYIPENGGGAIDLWVGPYTYWLFTEYQDVFGNNLSMSRWMSDCDRIWGIERNWRDFLDRPLCRDGYVGFCSESSMINNASLGYLAIRLMEENGTPFNWKLKKDNLK